MHGILIGPWLVGLYESLCPHSNPRSYWPSCLQPHPNPLTSTGRFLNHVLLCVPSPPSHATFIRPSGFHTVLCLLLSMVVFRKNTWGRTQRRHVFFRQQNKEEWMVLWYSQGDKMDWGFMRWMIRPYLHYFSNVFKCFSWWKQGD